jgi:hypothetical protein
VSVKSDHRVALIEDHNRSHESVTDAEMVRIKDEVVEILVGEYEDHVKEMNEKYIDYVNMDQWLKAKKAIEKRVTRSLNLRSKYRSDGSLRS